MMTFETLRYQLVFLLKIGQCCFFKKKSDSPPRSLCLTPTGVVQPKPSSPRGPPSSRSWYPPRLWAQGRPYDKVLYWNVCGLNAKENGMLFEIESLKVVVMLFACKKQNDNIPISGLLRSSDLLFLCL
jgi:hypothetical protein